MIGSFLRVRSFLTNQCEGAIDSANPVLHKKLAIHGLNRFSCLLSGTSSNFLCELQIVQVLWAGFCLTGSILIIKRSLV